MKKSLKIAFGTALCAALALTISFCTPKPTETQSDTQDTVSVETEIVQPPADTLSTEAPADTAAAQ